MAEESVSPSSSSVAMTEDEKQLAKLGYKQELSRSWSGFSNFAISFSIISILAGCFTTFGQGWNGGGPAATALPALRGAGLLPPAGRLPPEHQAQAPTL